jgi:phosphoribosylanthranilate isomerase
MVKIKICGITNHQDAQAAANLGVDALGFVFYKASPRYVKPEIARDIIRALPPFITTVGVFVDEEPEVIQQIMHDCGLQLVQLHGHESPGFCGRFAGRVIKAIRIKDRLSLIDIDRYPVEALLLDTHREHKFGGTGEVFNWELAQEAKKYGRIILAGGLNPENVQQAVNAVHPYGIDVSSGVEQEPGQKELKKLQDLVEKVRRLDYNFISRSN